MFGALCFCTYPMPVLHNRKNLSNYSVLEIHVIYLWIFEIMLATKYPILIPNSSSIQLPQLKQNGV